MKTLRGLFLAVAFMFLFVPQSHALVCADAQGLNSSDECWTKVTLSSVEVNLVSAGHALVRQIDATTPYQGSYEVVRSSASTQDAIVAGFAQGPIASGNSALVLVRGFGLVRTVGGIASGDTLKVAASGNVGVVVNSAAVSVETVAVALQTSSTNGTATRKAYIKLID